MRRSLLQTYEHCDSVDSREPFEQRNYGTETTSQVENAAIPAAAHPSLGSPRARATSPLSGLPTSLACLRRRWSASRRRSRPDHALSSPAVADRVVLCVRPSQWPREAWTRGVAWHRALSRRHPRSLPTRALPEDVRRHQRTPARRRRARGLARGVLRAALLHRSQAAPIEPYDCR